tara:strand:+ start:12499 stop:13191 length:693 start_codon:yes stop_codon:yes gene_type:complete
LCESLGLNVKIEPAIRIQNRQNWQPVQGIIDTNRKFVLAFTSQSGVRAYQEFLQMGGQPASPLKIYAVGHKTAAALSGLGLNPIIPDQQNGAGLAGKITGDFLSDQKLSGAAVLHFCGNRRRDEFRQFLEDSEITVRDVVVYETILEQMNLKNLTVDGILFYSPSAVQAFRDSGGFESEFNAELFAIGRTTGEELSIESGKHVHISPEPKTERFLEFVAQILNEVHTLNN